MDININELQIPYLHKETLKKSFDDITNLKLISASFEISNQITSVAFLIKGIKFYGQTSGGLEIGIYAIGYSSIGNAFLKDLLEDFENNETLMEKENAKLKEEIHQYKIMETTNKLKEPQRDKECQ